MIDGRRIEFGVSGLLYKHNMLFFDRPTESLWSQLLSRAVTGPRAGDRLRVLPAENTTWGEWRREHPDTRVLSFATGYAGGYRRDPYAALVFPRDRALLVSDGQRMKIYPLAELRKSRQPVVEYWDGKELKIVYDRRGGTARVETQAAFNSVLAYFADLRAFFPGAEIYASRNAAWGNK